MSGRGQLPSDLLLYNRARYAVRRLERLGRIAAGLDADLYSDRDPSRDVKNFAAVAYTVQVAGYLSSSP